MCLQKIHYRCKDKAQERHELTRAPPPPIQLNEKGALVFWVARIPWGCLLLAPTYVVQMLYPLIPLVVRRDLCDGGARTLMCLTPPPHRSHHRVRVLVYVLDDTHLGWGSS